MRAFRMLAGVCAAVGVCAAPGVSGAASVAVRYVALGDSYSAGVGAGDYTAASGGCERSVNAYPRLWANARRPASFRFVACSDATTTTVIRGQLSALSASTTLVSVTAGGNDAGFVSVLETCVLESTRSCLSAVSSAERFVARTLPGRLNAMLTGIRADAPSAHIVVLGYPDLYDLSRSSGCIGLSTADRTALDRGADDIDRALAAAAARHGDTFADVRPEFYGHVICDSSWLHSVDIINLGSSYHPTATGQSRGYLPAFTAAAP